MAGKLKPETQIQGTDLTVCDFWSWAYSDILNNRNRSVFAEFAVGVALGVVSSPRVEWDAVDLSYKSKGIEVKSTAFIQSWEQNKYSTAKFDIAPKLSWNSKTNTYAITPTRASDCYVFCVYPEKNHEKVNVLNVNTWEFYVISTTRINKVFGEQKTVALSRIKEISQPVTFAGLKDAVDRELAIK